MFNPRPRQAEVLKFTNGKMGVSAVPGSGKTQTLSLLAANLISQGLIKDDQEILVVTLVNSAVNNFSSRISTFIREFGLLPNLGYRVLTLHSLANQIVRERPDLVGLDNNFQIIDEREGNQILHSAVESWIQRNKELLSSWTNEKHSLNEPKISNGWRDAITSISKSFIRQSKDFQYTPQKLQEKIKLLNINDPFINLGVEIYQDYQRALNYRSAVDFDDLIRFTLMALMNDNDFLQRLQYRWPYILEDEAQDSSYLQEQILKLLCGENGNWVRVGDPNQAIYETFTTASPEHLKNFLLQPDVIAKTLPNSGRSTLSIIGLANELINWVNNAHPVEELRTSLTTPFIIPTPPGDPQPNPQDDPKAIFIYDKKMSATKELEIISDSVKRWLDENPNKTVAVLVPRNDRGAKLVEILQKNSIPYIELLQSSQSTRETAKILSEILRFIENPTLTVNIVRVFSSFCEIFFNMENVNKDEMIQLLKSCSFLEDYLYPRPLSDWIDHIAINSPDHEEKILPKLKLFREYLNRWLEAADLPIHQLLITLGQDLFKQQTELALTHKLALLLEQSAHIHPDWQLPDFVNELTLIADNRRKIFGFTDEDTGFDPDLYKGKVVVATYHKAKGLEWDRVYLTSVNNYDFPSAQKSDDSISEKYFYRYPYNLEAEIISKLKALINEDVESLYLDYGAATEKSRIDYGSERLRLLYVGITRAKKELIITWNTGDTHHSNSSQLTSSIPFLALKTYLETKNYGN
ncbi:MAG: ATP-dependent helicase [Anaerolineaceae bacterium]